MKEIELKDRIWLVKQMLNNRPPSLLKTTIQDLVEFWEKNNKMDMAA